MWHQQFLYLVPVGKKLLIFVPLITSHQIVQPVLLWKATIGFFLFSLCSSAQYILNDMTDLEADRQNPTKRLRPFASGDLPLQAGFVVAFGRGAVPDESDPTFRATASRRR